MIVNSIYIVDDDDAVRASLHSLLSLAFEAHIHNFRTGDDFLAVQEGLDPGCLLLDLHMPGTNGMQVLEHVADKGRFAPIILTGRGDLQTAVAALKGGAFDFIEKPYAFESIEQSVRNAFARLEKDLTAQQHVEKARVKIAQLSAREHDVLLGLIEGRSNKMIAYDLQISPRTVEIYRAHMMDKLGVDSLSDALRIAFSAGLVTA